MDERRRLLERVYSREGAGELPEDHYDQTTGETVRMTPSQWALAEYDRRHTPQGPSVEDPAEADAEQSDAGSAMSATAEDDTPHADDAASGRKPLPRRLRRALPYLAAAGGAVLGAALAIGIQGVVDSAAPQSSTTGASSVTAESGGALSAGSGQGDEGATLAAVTNYFANASRADNVPADVTRGFDATSFHQVAGTVTMGENSAIYAARRLDDTYCLVAVTRDGRAAETCGTMDDIARRGLTLTKDAVHDTDGRPVAVTVTWQTDGTLSWRASPSAG